LDKSAETLFSLPVVAAAERETPLMGHPALAALEVALEATEADPRLPRFSLTPVVEAVEVVATSHRVLGISHSQEKAVRQALS
jgi:hypothetical protein